ncbi:MAG: hypothetical protein R2932_03960 [Caldilineaceae bacterium]
MAKNHTPMQHTVAKAADRANAATEALATGKSSESLLANSQPTGACRRFGPG